MHKNGSQPVHDTLAGVDAPPVAALRKELGQLRARLAEIASMLRQTYGAESVEAGLAAEISAAVQRLEAQISGCPSARIE
jgi:hypothetical protein